MPRYLVVDVFTQNALEGNALAVFPDSAGLDDSTMQKIARELNLSETVFFTAPSRPEFASRLRIFTPSRELPFAGHPTIGASFVLLSESIVPSGCCNFVLEEGVGPVPIRVEPGRRPLIWLTTPRITFGQTYDPAVCAQALGLEPADLLEAAPQFVSAGNPTVFIGLKTKEAVDRASLDSSGMRAIKGDGEWMCVFVFARVAAGAYSRMFAPEYGIAEDPATGSATGPLAAYMMRHNLAPSTDGTQFISEQGTKMGRRSLLHVLIRGENGSEGIDIGGYVTPLIEAMMTL